MNDKQKIKIINRLLLLLTVLVALLIMIGENIMQINHLKAMNSKINSWLNRSNRIALLKNEGFSVYDGSSITSRCTVDFINGHGEPETIKLFSEGQWSDNWSKDLIIRPRLENLSGWQELKVPKILLRSIFDQIEIFLPLPKWTKNDHHFVSFRNMVVVTDDGYRVVSQEEWICKYEYYCDFEIYQNHREFIASELNKRLSGRGYIINNLSLILNSKEFNKSLSFYDFIDVLIFPENEILKKLDDKIIDEIYGFVKRPPKRPLRKTTESEVKDEKS